ncbi:Clavaminate synthase-like protein [Gloeophyllum trabeum ATCC 11539]|uniref:Clavaminate synthase-like protein n=1 Tax=Gloeophyllum trabeum (strain ATCC 11539 / FP-39264 / Madison 617) TaxID=670483 RepID=S7QBT8_GLOTA|nr:Clavaminate synthase-like protein [Gloeophyllum trabeum ATCC 11539]EPQ56812.1 Clavaminate synthase-like protein [Gloeophyllum trabeum ATCC 11539]
MPTDFSTVPVLDYSKATDPNLRAEFIEELRNAVINVGFLYLSNHSVDPAVVKAMTDHYIPRLFALPQEEKESIKMANSPHFFGYTEFAREFTKEKADLREQFDYGVPFVNKYQPGEPDYKKLWGPSQWPQENMIPGFKATWNTYLSQVEDLGYDFVQLLAECLDLPSDALNEFFDKDKIIENAKGNVMHQAKIVKYPPVGTVESNQGIGPHFDAGFLTFLLQASANPGLQVQNMAGEWIDVFPIPGTFVINIGRALEHVTQGLARATCHRVVAPLRGTSSRYSIPFFQNLRQEVCLNDVHLEIKPEMLALKEKRGYVADREGVNYAEYGTEAAGTVALIGRVKSHPDVGQIHYPELTKQLFPHGLPEWA